MREPEPIIKDEFEVDPVSIGLRLVNYECQWILYITMALLLLPEVLNTMFVALH